jgi:hypothetical protein
MKKNTMPPIVYKLLPLGLSVLLSACVTVPTNAPQTPAQSAQNMPAAPTIFSRMTETQQQTTLRTQIAQQDLLYRIAAPLLTNNTPLCQNNARNLLGFTAKNKYSFPPDYVEAAQALGFGDELQITGILPESGAAKSGLQHGDLLISAASKRIPKGKDAERQAGMMLGPIVTGRTPIQLTVSRKGTHKTTTVPLTLACAFNIELGNTDNVNSYADGRRILVTRGMLKFAKSDEELAYVIAKEMAHNALGHATKQRQVATIGGVIDNLMRMQPEAITQAGTAGIRPYTEALDTESDTVALYMLARAGVNIDNAAAFWRRLATEYPANVANSYTALHPTLNQRIAKIEQVTKTIKNKQASSANLMP